MSTEEEWREAASLMSLFEAIAESGGVALLKFDGERESGEACTVVVSGGKLGGEGHFRTDAKSPFEAISAAIQFYHDEER